MARQVPNAPKVKSKERIPIKKLGNNIPKSATKKNK